MASRTGTGWPPGDGCGSRTCATRTWWSTRRAVARSCTAWSRTLCRDAGFEPRIRHEVAETSTLVTFVAAGLGVAVVPEPVGTLGVPGVTYRPLSPAEAGVELAAAVRAGEEGRHVARTLEVLGTLV